MNRNTQSAVSAIVTPGNVPGLRKLLVKLTLMRARTSTEAHEGIDTSTSEDDLDIPSALEGVGLFVRLSEIAKVTKGPTGIKDARPGPYPLVVTAEDRGTCDHYDLEGEAVLIPTVSSTGHGDASLKRIHYQEGRFAVGSILAAVQVRDRALHSARFLYEYLSVFKDELLVARMSGTANVSLTVKKIEGVPIPLVPFAQQQQLHDLMRLCDALEAKGRLEAEQHTRLLDTLLGTLIDSTTPEGLAANWQRVAEHGDLLLERPEAMDALEQTILQLAVRGLLVTRVASDESARVLLDRIAAKRGRQPHKSPLGLAVLDPDAAPYELPSHWEWARLGDLVENMGSGWSPACDDGERTDPTRWAVLRTTAVQAMEFRAREHKAIPLKLAPRPEIEVQSGDILVTRAGPMNRVGISCWVDQTPSRLMLSDKIVRFHPVTDELSPAFVVLALNAGWTRELLEAAKTGMAASQVNVSQADLKSLWVPVCGLEEQNRILARVTELRRLCAVLRERLSASQATQSRLAEALAESVAE